MCVNITSEVFTRGFSGRLDVSLRELEFLLHSWALMVLNNLTDDSGLKAVGQAHCRHSENTLISAFWRQQCLFISYLPRQMRRAYDNKCITKYSFLEYPRIYFIRFVIFQHLAVRLELKLPTIFSSHVLKIFTHIILAGCNHVQTSAARFLQIFLYPGVTAPLQLFYIISGPFRKKNTSWISVPLW